MWVSDTIFYRASHLVTYTYTYDALVSLVLSFSRSLVLSLSRVRVCARACVDISFQKPLFLFSVYLGFKSIKNVFNFALHKIRILRAHNNKARERNTERRLVSTTTTTTTTAGGTPRSNDGRLLPRRALRLPHFCARHGKRDVSRGCSGVCLLPSQVLIFPLCLV